MGFALALTGSIISQLSLPFVWGGWVIGHGMCGKSYSFVTFYGTQHAHSDQVNWYLTNITIFCMKKINIFPGNIKPLTVKYDVHVHHTQRSQTASHVHYFGMCIKNEWKSWLLLSMPNTPTSETASHDFAVFKSRFSLKPIYGYD